MLFNSIYYAFFLPTAVALYWAVPRRARYPLLLVASYLFYMAWIPGYVGLILAQTALTYLFGLGLAHRRHRGLLVLAVGANLGVLAYFKYANFLLDSARAAGLDLPAARILLPLGISFFTFEFIHYVVDVWRGHPPVRDMVQFALFPGFFPTQIAGPIKRYQSFVQQLSNYPRFDPVQAGEGVHLILRGLFKKVVLADNLAGVVNVAFDHLTHLGTGDAWLVTYGFAFQIFFDFSGYTDIGRGSALLLGFQVPENFAAPYLARNLADFWHRWHMSLSSWLRDYLYIPLGGSRRGRLATYRNLFLTMTLGGLWHGAAWHFAAWGAYHGLGLGAGRGGPGEPRPPRGADAAPLARVAPLLRTLIATALTFHFVCLGWVLFRAPDLPAAGILLNRMLTPVAGGDVLLPAWRVTIGAVGLGYFAVAAGGPWLQTRLPSAVWAGAARWAWAWRPAYYLALVVWMLVFPATAQRFIYFQF